MEYDAYTYGWLTKPKFFWNKLNIFKSYIAKFRKFSPYLIHHCLAHGHWKEHFVLNDKMVASVPAGGRSAVSVASWTSMDW